MDMEDQPMTGIDHEHGAKAMGSTNFNKNVQNLNKSSKRFLC